MIGHSNGGNLALVTLVEHPEVIQTAIPQAANAWVSPDLPARQPGLFDPDRVEREDPHWMDQMKAWHADTYGPDYWRELLLLTVNELISEPNYTPADLAKVQRPTLVIQGENDRVNAPYEHARNSSPAISRRPSCGFRRELVIRVHLEIPAIWIEKVLDFLRRRGENK